jgi:hypothetical protein
MKAAAPWYLCERFQRVLSSQSRRKAINDANHALLDPEDNENIAIPLIYVTLDTAFHNAIHANPDYLTMYHRDSIEVVVLCGATNSFLLQIFGTLLPVLVLKKV